MLFYWQCIEKKWFFREFRGVPRLSSMFAVGFVPRRQPVSLQAVASTWQHCRDTTGNFVVTIVQLQGSRIRGSRAFVNFVKGCHTPGLSESRLVAVNRPALDGWDLTAERVANSPYGLALPALLDRIESEMAMP